MNKEYMLKVCQERIKELQSKYRLYFDTDKGPSKSISGAACIRSRILKDIRTLKLLEYLLMYCPDTMSIDNQELQDAFDRLTEPRKLR